MIQNDTPLSQDLRKELIKGYHEGANEDLEIANEGTLDPAKCPVKTKCIEAIMTELLRKSDEVTEGVDLKPKEWLMFYRLRTILYYFPDPQPQHISEQEAQEMKQLQETHDFSIRDLAFIFMRSKASVCEALKRKLDDEDKLFLIQNPYPFSFKKPYSFHIKKPYL